MPISLYTATENLNGLTGNIIDAINLSDITFIITSIIAISCYIILCKAKYYKYSYIPIILLYIMIFFTGIPFLQANIEERNRLADHFQELEDKRSLYEIILEATDAIYYNDSHESFFLQGFLVNAVKYLQTRTTKKDFDKSLLPYLKEKKYETHIAPDNRNIILILIESLSSYPINRSYNGIEVTPNINKYVNTSNSIFYKKMESQTQLGESSDGQFIYLNGILPLKNEVSIYKVADNKLLSFCYFLKNHYTYMTIPTDEKQWNQKTMCEAYGINTLYSRNTIEGDGYDDWLNDEQLFKYAASLDTTYTQPFCSILLSSSTHSPWNKTFEPSTIKYPSHYSSELRTYLNNVHYVDKWLGYYIESLKKHSLYDNSIIIITADHKPNIPKLNVKSPELFNDIPLIIMNVNKEKFTTAENTRIYQTSLFPTILDIMGINSEWRGVGKSIYMPDSIRTSAFEKQRSNLEQKISEEIIMSDYFKHPQSSK